jgi:hypothetical protein
MSKNLSEPGFGGFYGLRGEAKCFLLNPFLPISNSSFVKFFNTSYLS